MLPGILPTIQSTTKLFLTGPFGSGKTTAAVERMRWLLRQERVRGDDILILVPQRTLAQPYFAAMRAADMPPGPPPVVTTMSGLTRNAVELYWPLLARDAGFVGGREPTFLNLETAQHHMARFVDAALAEGEFDAFRLDRNRIITQVLDNLNKAALHGFTVEEAYERLELAVPMDDQRTARLNALRAAQRLSREFRALCLDETLVDFSLQVELLNRHILQNPWSRTHFFRTHKHIIYDNAEEDNLSAHRLVQAWLPSLDSALILADSDAGYRVFLGADPQGVDELAAACERRETLAGSYVMPESLQALAWRVDESVAGRAAAGPAPDADARALALDNLVIPDREIRFYPQMIDWAVEQIAHLVHNEGTPPEQIAVLAPFVSDALRFSLQTRLAERGISLTTHRPSRALRDEPAARCLLTLALLAHPHWRIQPAPADVTLALTLAIASLDPVRANLLTRIVYPANRPGGELGRFGALEQGVQERITFTAGEEYERLRAWIAAYRASAETLPLDQFLARLFGELLSQPGYGFHDDYDAARISYQLVESARNFRWALEGQPGVEQSDLGLSYYRLFESGALGALYAAGWREAQDAVFLAPAYTFLLRNRPVDVQIWLDIGSGGWWERLYQPLTHPYVLSARWPAHELWTDRSEYETRQETMRRLLLGLVRRARRRIYLGVSGYSESGYEQTGPLLGLVNRLLATSERRAQPAQ